MVERQRYSPTTWGCSGCLLGGFAGFIIAALALDAFKSYDGVYPSDPGWESLFMFTVGFSTAIAMWSAARQLNRRVKRQDAKTVPPDQPRGLV